MTEMAEVPVPDLVKSATPKEMQKMPTRQTAYRRTLSPHGIRSRLVVVVRSVPGIRTVAPFSLNWLVSAANAAKEDAENSTTPQCACMDWNRF